MGIFVCDANGNRLGTGRTTISYFGKILSAIPLGIGFLMATFTSDKRALQNRLRFVIDQQDLTSFKFFYGLPPVFGRCHHFRLGHPEHYYSYTFLGLEKTQSSWVGWRRLLWRRMWQQLRWWLWRRKRRRGLVPHTRESRIEP